MRRREDHCVCAASSVSGRLSEADRVCGYAGPADLLVFRFCKRAGKKKRKASVFIEEEKVQQGFLRIRGWAVADEPVKIQIFDENKQKLNVEILRTERVDVEQLYEEMDSKDKSGFFVELTNLTGKLCILFFTQETQNQSILFI